MFPDSRLLTPDSRLSLRMTIIEAQQLLIQRLSPIYDKREAGNIADMVMESVTGYKNSERIIHKTSRLNNELSERLEKYLIDLEQQKPVQYVLKEAWFYGMNFYVDENVLIPRPETEELVNWVVEEIHSSESVGWNRRTIILDVGTGSGCIPVSLKKAIPSAELWGCDLSELALNVARFNSAKLGHLVDFQGLDFLNHVQRNQLPHVNILVSNPPYVPEKDKDSMQPNVLKYEPHIALFVPDNDPLIFYRAIADFGHHRMRKDGIIFVEIHEDLAVPLTELFTSAGYSSIEVKRDMQGKERMMKVKW